jgi:MFS family permease
MTVTASIEPDRPAGAAADKSRERRALGVASGAHVMHDGYTDLVWIALPIWQAEFGLTYAAVGLLRMIYSGTLAALQIPASMVAERIGSRVVLAAGTALAGLCYCFAGLSNSFPLLIAALFLGGLGAATQHPIASALVTRTFTGSRALAAFGTYNFAGDVGKVLIPVTATTLLLFMPWRPAYGMLGLVGIAIAVVIFALMPRLPPEQPAAKAPDASTMSAEDRALSTREAARLRAGYRILVAFGISDSLVRGAFFVMLPFLLIGKGAVVTTAGFALTLVFIGGALGKLAFGWVGKWIGTVATIVVCQMLTAAGIVATLVLPLTGTMVLLPFLGVVLNGVTTVIYGSVPDYSPPDRGTRGLSVFYTISIGAAAVAPPISGLVGDAAGIPNTIIAVAVLTLATIPLAFPLRHGGRSQSAAV